MKFGFSNIRSLFQTSNAKNTQSATISGDNSVVDQRTTNIFMASPNDELMRGILANEKPSSPSFGYQSLPSEESEGDDREEIKRIIEYRALASEGNSTAALSLLTKLKADPRYASGYFAFRLNFNIGIILHNIGELEEASATLRVAHAHYPEDDKAKTGLALAELLDGRSELAKEQAFALLASRGDHRDLAACIVLNAARRLGQNIDLREVLETSDDSPDVQAAYLEYLQELRPEEYFDALRQAFGANAENEAIAKLWSLSILDDMKRNQAFLLGAKMSDGFEETVTKSAEILRRALEKSLEHSPPNKLLLPTEANNAAVALRLSGSVVEAGRLVDKVLERFPEFTMDLAQIRAVLLLQEDKDSEALALIRPLSESCELQVMASELEAQAGQPAEALTRINSVLKMNVPDEFLPHALAVKARIGINGMNQNAADEALEDLAAIAPKAPALVLLRSAYDRAFVVRTEQEVFEQLPVERPGHSSLETKLLASLEDADGWDFFTLLQTADELLARGYYRECTDLLRGKVSLSKESPALTTLCDACLRGHLGSLAKEISDGLSPEVKKSVFGCKFGANVAYLSGEVAKAVPLTRRLYEQNPNSISALEWHVQSLLRTNDRKRVQRLIGKLNDRELLGTIKDRQGYVTLLVFCGEVKRARSYAYRLFCENQNDHQAWMALSSSVLAFGRPPGASDDLDVTSVQKDSTFEVLKPDGSKQVFTIEADEDLFPLMNGNISPDHPVAQAAADMTPGEEFDWPFKGAGQARILSVKHKALAAFHMILAQFEERFPKASGFKSVSINFGREDGLDEMKAMLRQRAEYSQSKAMEYDQGSYPIYILGYHLGIDPIDAFLGLKAECGFSPKVSSCSHADQDKARVALNAARASGLIADAFACYLLRRLGVSEAVEQEFGAIGVTQKTIDIFAKRLQEAESSSSFDTDTGTRRASSIAVRNGQIILSEITEDELNHKIEIMRGDLEWLKSKCELVSAVAKVDPDDSIIRFRSEEGGGFFDDIFASDGSGRVLISDDFHLREWAEGLFSTRSSWIQALLFYLQEVNKLPIQVVVKNTIDLCRLGEVALSTNTERVLAAAEMLASYELSDDEFALFCLLLGQPGADIRSHIEVAVGSIIGLWSRGSLKTVRQKATGVILRNLVRHQGENTRIVLDAIQTLAQNRDVSQYIAGWRVGHFLT